MTRRIRRARPPRSVMPRSMMRVPVTDGTVTLVVSPGRTMTAVLTVEDYNDRTLSVQLTEDHAMKLAQILGTVWPDR